MFLDFIISTEENIISEEKSTFVSEEKSTGMYFFINYVHITFTYFLNWFLINNGNRKVSFKIFSKYIILSLFLTRHLTFDICCEPLNLTLETFWRYGRYYLSSEFHCHLKCNLIFFQFQMFNIWSVYMEVCLFLWIGRFRLVGLVYGV